MVIVGLLQWWYGAGWRERLGMVGARLARIFDAFSLDLLVKTWFAPFRQIGAGQVRGNISIQFRAFLDRLFSRLVGGVIRTFVIVFGTVTLVIAGVLGLVEVLMWLMVPLFPVLGAILFATGWMPYAGI